MNDAQLEKIKEQYYGALHPLFFPDDPVSKDIIKYFASLLRIEGMEDRGWDPYLESRGILEDLNNFLTMDLPYKVFQNSQLTKWRIGLLLYSHIVEMDAPYEVITNLLRFKLEKGYSPNPCYDFLNSKAKKKQTLYPLDKIHIIKLLDEKAGLIIGDIFDEFYDAKLRNAIDHSDYIITDSEFRARKGVGGKSPFKVSLLKVNEQITKAKIFISTFFALEMAARKLWGEFKGKALPYDENYKGLMEILVDEKDLLCGFKIHWPNNTESIYRRTGVGIDMVNCMLDINNTTINFFVGSYARKRGEFSPLVEAGEKPVYTKLENTGEIPAWPDNN